MTNIYPFVKKASKAFQVPMEMIYAIIRNEWDGSSKAYNPEANTPGDPSFGLMGLKLSTARDMGYKGDGPGLWDNETNIFYGTAYLRWLMDHFSTEKTDVYAAYNAGLGNTPKGGPYFNREYVIKALQAEMFTGTILDLNTMLPLTIPVAFLGVMAEIMNRLGGGNK